MKKIGYKLLVNIASKVLAFLRSRMGKVVCPKGYPRCSNTLTAFPSSYYWDRSALYPGKIFYVPELKKEEVMKERGFQIGDRVEVKK